MNILITGGAGFIGQHTAKKLLENNHNVYVLDCFSEQIHGKSKNNASNKLYGKIFKGDIRDKDCLDEVFSNNIEIIYHFAAETGTGQSMYEISEYSEVNIQGTAILLNYLLENKLTKRIKKIIVASSRAIYGEGKYESPDHGIVYPDSRKEDDMLKGEFENKCQITQKNLILKATDESTPFNPTSIYGLTKQVQEQMVLMFAKNSNIQAFALRYQNVYGPGQSLLNPYTGILAVFSNLARQKKEINVFEDGLESRDFVYIDDVVNANILCLNTSNSFSGPLNIGTGESVQVLKVANTINEYFGSNSSINISGMFRIGDIRHNKADINSARNIIGFKSEIDFDKGIKCFLDWTLTQDVPENYGFRKSLDELSDKGLFKNK